MFEQFVLLIIGTILVAGLMQLPYLLYRFEKWADKQIVKKLSKKS